MYAKLRLPPQNRSFSRCILRQTPTLTGPNDRIEPNYFLYRDVSFLAEKKSCFFGSPECVWLLWASPEWKNEEQIDFYENKSGNRKIVIFPEIVISGIPLSRVRRPGSHVVTDFPFYGFLRRASQMAADWMSEPVWTGSDIQLGIQ